MENGILLSQLERVAREAARHSYCPYSRFPVGAAVLAETGEIFAGCNVENAAYGLTICAERAAIFNSVCSGVRAIDAVVVYTPTPRATAPCGACRQVIREFGPSTKILCICDTEHRLESTLDRLLPESFDASTLFQNS